MAHGKNAEQGGSPARKKYWKSRLGSRVVWWELRDENDEQEAEE